jgi:predicted nucleotidyltransferase component of viral defense system
MPERNYLIIKYLEKIVTEQRILGHPKAYIVNALKEYLQAYVLYYIYTSGTYNKKLIFTGGTCLRHFYELPRLSEDIDFDFNENISVDKLADDLKYFFNIRYKYSAINISLHQQKTQILLKFPVLHELKLAGLSESNNLHIKIDLSENPSKNYNIEISIKSLFGFNFIAKHYDLSSLFSGKLHAILKRNILKGKENTYDIKGRDYFDLLWFLNKSVKPNIARLSDMLGITLTMGELEKELDNKIATMISKYSTSFKSDIIALIEDQDFIDAYIYNYREAYLNAKKKIFY